MRTQLLTTTLMAAPAAAFAGGVDGVWKTEPNDAGGYLQVTVTACASDASKTCGVVSNAFKAGAEDAAYPYLGRIIIDNMTNDGDGRYSGGTVFDPENGKTYKSKMSIKGDALNVDGCIGFICEANVWNRVK